MKNVLFVFAHQDDESFCATRIERERSFGNRVLCAYLTDGGGYGVDPRRRDEESRRVLADFGVPADDLHFLGSDRGLPDGQLALRLPEAFDALEERLSGVPLARIYCLAYEGGHHDHDASHLVALRLAARRGLLRRTWQIAVYNGYRTWGRLFRVLAPLPIATRRCTRRLPLGVALRHLTLAFRYPSQWRSFLFLFPGYLWKRGLLRRETLQAVDPRAPTERPHAGLLLYERLYGFPWARFRAAAAPFVRDLLAELEP